MKKITSIVLVLFCILSLAACGAEEPASNRLDKTSDEIAKALPDALDLSDLDCLTEKDESAETFLVFIYGLKEEMLEGIDSYFITNSHRSTDARAITVIFFKDNDKTAENIEAVKGCINDVFLKNLVNTTATYDAEQSKIASSATFKTYDNALVFASYDAEGNDAVIKAIEE